jgi:hypothetical protein
VNARPVSVQADKQNYKQGERVYIDGNGFSPDTNVTVNITYPGGSNITNQTANNTGGFSFYYYIGYSASLGVYNVTAFDNIYPNLNDTTNFTVEQRVATVSTDSPIYGADEVVNITGMWYTYNGTVQIIIRDVDSGVIAPDHPNNTLADADGNITYFWNTTDTCAGNYSVEAYDLNNTWLNATTYFNITGDTAVSFALPTAVVEGDGDPASVSNVNTSNDVRENLALSNGELDYLELNFTNNITGGSTIETAIFNLEHYVTASSKTTVDSVRWYNSTDYQVISCSGITNTETEENQTCDIISYVDTVSEANDVSIRVYYYREPGGGDAFIDYSFVNITYSGAGTCTDWGNVASSVDAITVTSPVILNAGTTRLVECNLTIYDDNGWDDVEGANATFYYYLNSTTDSDDNNVHYSNISCTNTSNDGLNTVYFTCGFYAFYYANNGTWYCNATAWDASTDDYADNSTTIDALYAINSSNDTIDYGNIEAGANSLEELLNVTNIGNMPINVSVRGYGGFDEFAGENISLFCASGNISVGYERYSLISEPFNSKNNLTSNDTIINLSLKKQIDASIITNITYWQQRAAPENYPLGICNGTVVFTATT